MYVPVLLRPPRTSLAAVSFERGLIHQLGSEEVLSDRNILLLQYVALFHDATRKDDYNADIWENESAEMCRAFLVENGISEEEALRFSSLIIKKENGGLLGKILQSADCLDIMRCRRVFHVDRMSIYSDFAQVEGAIDDYLIPLVKEAGKLIQAQSDMQNDVFVTLDKKKIIEFKKSYNAENPQSKEKYELAKNCYARVTEDFKNFFWLAKIYTDNVAPYIVYPAEEKEEEDNFFQQEEILSYALIVKEILPEDKDLLKGEIYLQKIKSKLAYVFRTLNGEVARHYIPRNVFPPHTDLSQTPFTDGVHHIILQWLLKNETGIYLQKAVRTDERIFFPDLCKTLGGNVRDTEQKCEDDEKQEEDTEENKTLNKITLTSVRSFKCHLPPCHSREGGDPSIKIIHIFYWLMRKRDCFSSITLNYCHGRMGSRLRGNDT